ncbi:MAG: hypothetical protein IJ345_04275 [Clostridia bacterium]|nr:hypothetical protein [Clostridia bacterium]
MFDSSLLVGIFVGLLCGLIPLGFGILKKDYLWAAIGMVLTVITGVVFALLNKSPFTSAITAILFLLFIFATQKRKEKHSEDHDETDHLDDL